MREFTFIDLFAGIGGFRLAPDFAHGFYVPEINTAHVIYKVSEYWSPEHERAIRYDDPEIGLGLEDEHIIISDKDRDAPLLKDVDNNFVYEEASLGKVR